MAPVVVELLTDCGSCGETKCLFQESRTSIFYCELLPEALRSCDGVERIPVGDSLDTFFFTTEILARQGDKEEFDWFIKNGSSVNKLVVQFPLPFGHDVIGGILEIPCGSMVQLRIKIDRFAPLSMRHMLQYHWYRYWPELVNKAIVTCPPQNEKIDSPYHVESWNVSLTNQAQWTAVVPKHKLIRAEEKKILLLQVVLDGMQEDKVALDAIRFPQISPDDDVFQEVILQFPKCVVVDKKVARFCFEQGEYKSKGFPYLNPSKKFPMKLFEGPYFNERDAYTALGEKSVQLLQFTKPDDTRHYFAMGKSEGAQDQRPLAQLAVGLDPLDMTFVEVPFKKDAEVIETGSMIIDLDMSRKDDDTDEGFEEKGKLLDGMICRLKQELPALLQNEFQFSYPFPDQTVEINVNRSNRNKKHSAHVQINIGIPCELRSAFYDRFYSLLPRFTGGVTCLEVAIDKIKENQAIRHPPARKAKLVAKETTLNEIGTLICDPDDVDLPYENSLCFYKNFKIVPVVCDPQSQLIPRVPPGKTARHRPQGDKTDTTIVPANIIQALGDFCRRRGLYLGRLAIQHKEISDPPSGGVVKLVLHCFVGTSPEKRVCACLDFVEAHEKIHLTEIVVLDGGSIFAGCARCYGHRGKRECVCRCCSGPEERERKHSFSRWKQIYPLESSTSSLEPLSSSNLEEPLSSSSLEEPLFLSEQNRIKRFAAKFRHQLLRSEEDVKFRDSFLMLVKSAVLSKINTDIVNLDYGRRANGDHILIIQVSNSCCPLNIDGDSHHVIFRFSISNKIGEVICPACSLQGAESTCYGNLKKTWDLLDAAQRHYITTNGGILWGKVIYGGGYEEGMPVPFTPGIRPSTHDRVGSRVLINYDDLLMNCRQGTIKCQRVRPRPKPSLLLNPVDKTGALISRIKGDESPFVIRNSIPNSIEYVSVDFRKYLLLGFMTGVCKMTKVPFDGSLPEDVFDPSVTILDLFPDRKMPIPRRDSGQPLPQVLLLEASLGSGKTHLTLRLIVLFVIAKLLGLKYQRAVEEKDNEATETWKQLFYSQCYQYGQDCPLDPRTLHIKFLHLTGHSYGCLDAELEAMDFPFTGKQILEKVEHPVALVEVARQQIAGSICEKLVNNDVVLTNYESRKSLINGMIARKKFSSKSVESVVSYFATGTGVLVTVTNSIPNWHCATRDRRRVELKFDITWNDEVSQTASSTVSKLASPDLADASCRIHQNATVAIFSDGEPTPSAVCRVNHVSSPEEQQNGVLLNEKGNVQLVKHNLPDMRSLPDVLKKYFSPAEQHRPIYQPKALIVSDVLAFVHEWDVASVLDKRLTFVFLDRKDHLDRLVDWKRKFIPNPDDVQIFSSGSSETLKAEMKRNPHFMYGSEEHPGALQVNATPILPPGTDLDRREFFNVTFNYIFGNGADASEKVQMSHRVRYPMDNCAVVYFRFTHSKKSCYKTALFIDEIQQKQSEINAECVEYTGQMPQVMGHGPFIELLATPSLATKLKGGTFIESSVSTDRYKGPGRLMDLMAKSSCTFIALPDLKSFKLHHPPAPSFLEELSRTIDGIVETKATEQWSNFNAEAFKKTDDYKNSGESGVRHFRDLYDIYQLDFSKMPAALEIYKTIHGEGFKKLLKDEPNMTLSPDQQLGTHLATTALFSIEIVKEFMLLAIPGDENHQSITMSAHDVVAPTSACTVALASGVPLNIGQHLESQSTGSTLVIGDDPYRRRLYYLFILWILGCFPDIELNDNEIGQGSNSQLIARKISLAYSPELIVMQLCLPRNDWNAKGRRSLKNIRNSLRSVLHTSDDREKKYEIELEGIMKKLGCENPGTKTRGLLSLIARNLGLKFTSGDGFTCVYHKKGCNEFLPAPRNQDLLCQTMQFLKTQVTGAGNHEYYQARETTIRLVKMLPFSVATDVVPRENACHYLHEVSSGDCVLFKTNEKLDWTLAPLVIHTGDPDCIPALTIKYEIRKKLLPEPDEGRGKFIRENVICSQFFETEEFLLDLSLRAKQQLIAAHSILPSLGCGEPDSRFPSAEAWATTKLKVEEEVATAVEDEVSEPLQQQVENEFGDGPDDTNDSGSVKRMQEGEGAMEDNVESGPFPLEVDDEFEEVPNDAKNSSSIKRRQDFEEADETRPLSKRHNTGRINEQLPL